jgi:peptide/nickel transport system permease protein
MARLALRALAILAGTIFVASSGIFFLIHLSGDPTYGFLPVNTSPEIRESVRDRLGLDQPLLTQYVMFLRDAFTLDFGYSWSLRQPAAEAVLRVFPATLQLALIGTVSAVVVGVVLGVITSARRSGPLEWVLSATTLVGLAIPGFWLGTLLILLFAVELGWFPSSGSAGLRSMVLPIVALTLHPASMIARLVRANMREVESTMYIRTARAKGLPARAVQWRHMLPNAVLPAVAYVGLHAAGLIGGAIVIESVFAWPGVGRMALQAALERDMPVIHAFVVLSAVMVTMVNILVDLTAMVIDPRLRSSQVMSHAT